MEVQLQSVLVPQDGICGITDMYYHDAFGRLTFDGYFNLIYIAKRKKYTNLSKIMLKIRLRGFKKLILTDKALKMQTDITSRITCYMHSVFYGIAEEDLQVFETVILKMTENTR